MCEYAGRQLVGIDLHRRRSVIARTTEAGDTLEAVRISNDLDLLAAVMSRAGEAPQVVLEACDLADLLRMGRLAQAWIASPATRELAKCGIQVLMSDLFAPAGLGRVSSS